MDEPSIIHVNIVDYASTLAQAKDPQLKGRAFVIAAERASRRIVLSPSQAARKEGIERGMSVLQAQRTVPSLIVLAPDAKLIAQANTALDVIIDHYSPSTISEQGGHRYLDMSGTRRLFGPTVDSALRLKEEIRCRMGIDAAVAVASNKLVAKIGTRAIRPYGVAQIPLDETPRFLASQEVSLLTGVGPATTTLLKAVGITQIGALARLSDEEVIAFLGPRGVRLRDSARGIDAAPFLPVSPTERTIARQIDFAEPIIDGGAIEAALRIAISDAALQMRSEMLGSSKILLTLFYVDGKRHQSHTATTGQWLYDDELGHQATRLIRRAFERRVRLVGLSLTLADLSPPLGQIDLFAPAQQEKQQRLQDAVDQIKGRWGSDILLHAAAIAHEH